MSTARRTLLRVAAVLDPKPVIEPFGAGDRMAFDALFHDAITRGQTWCESWALWARQLTKNRPKLWQDDLHWYGQMVKDLGAVSSV
jgi:hypothetical protein